MDEEKMIPEKMITEEEESFLSLLLNNQTGYTLAVADTLVGQPSLEVLNVAQEPQQADDQSAKQEASAEPEQPVLKFRKAIPAHVLKDLSVRDPKRARRIIANRMSAARAKEKKKVHIYMLENEVQNLQCEWNATSAHLTLLQNEGQTLTDEQGRLKERVSMVLQRLRLQEELNEQIKKEVEYLKTSAGYNGNNCNNADGNDCTNANGNDCNNANGNGNECNNAKDAEPDNETQP